LDSGATRRAREIWDSFAPGYDRGMRWCEPLLFAGGRQWVCGQARGEVLEVAVGTGRNLEFYPSGVRLTGIELSPAMLALARRRAVDLGRQIALFLGDAQALPFANAAFDTVVCTLSLCSIPDDRAAIIEMSRVLRPGGRLLLVDHVGSHHRVLFGIQRFVEKLSIGRTGDYQTRRPLPLVERAGLVVTRSERLKLGTVERVLAVKPGHGGES
jgi:ubiquinone/menaquinone biosynthesis C-methylase UbiE